MSAVSPSIANHTAMMLMSAGRQADEIIYELTYKSIIFKDISDCPRRNVTDTVRIWIGMVFLPSGCLWSGGSSSPTVWAFGLLIWFRTANLVPSASLSWWSSSSSWCDRDRGKIGSKANPTSRRVQKRVSEESSDWWSIEEHMSDTKVQESTGSLAYATICNSLM